MAKCAILKVTKVISKDQNNSEPCAVKGKLVKTKGFSSLNINKKNPKSVSFMQDRCPRIGIILKGELHGICNDTVSQERTKQRVYVDGRIEYIQPKKASRPEDEVDYYLSKSQVEDCN